MNSHNSLLLDTLSGTLLSVVPLLLSTDIVKTAVLAAVGAAVSFTVSLLLRYLLRRIKK